MSAVIAVSPKANCQIGDYCLLVPVKASGSYAGSADFPKDCELLTVNVDIRQGGAWAGVSTLVEEAYLWLSNAGASEVLKRHNYELHMALPQYREQLPLLAGSLTDLAHGAEKTRNFPVDRAYRIVHGLVDFIMEWRELSGAGRPYLVVVENFSLAQRLARRFFLETARRAYLRSQLFVIVPSGELLQADLKEGHLEALRFPLPAQPRWNQLEIDPIKSDEEARQIFRSFTTLDYTELNYNRLLEYYASQGDALGSARASLAALCVYNHLGYYYEGNTLIGNILPHFGDLVGDSEEKRWNYTGNFFQSYIMRGDIVKAREIILQLSEPYLRQNLYLAKMEYILGIIDLRHEKPPRLGAAEEHFSRAITHISAAKDEIEPHEYIFHRVFIENGLAYLRVKQGREGEAIDLCQSGYRLLTEQLGSDAHRLHRSVLQYNTAQVYSMMGQLDAALSHYEIARSMDPNYSEYYNEMANIYQRQERFQDALAFYDAAIRLSPPYPEVYFNKSVCLARIGDWQGAIENCKYSLDLDPNQADAYLIQAEIYENMGKIEQALDSYDEAIAADGRCFAAIENKAVLLFNLGRLEDALYQMNLVIALDTPKSDHYENRAAIYRALGKWDLCKEDEKSAELTRLYNDKQGAVVQSL
jgi:tetratricopeptide (TPR) repeat protein